MSKLDHAASLISSDAASTRKATLQHRTTNRKRINTCYDALYLRWKVASLKDARQRPMLLLHSVVVKNATRKSRVFHVDPCTTRFLPKDCSQDFMQITDPAGL